MPIADKLVQKSFSEIEQRSNSDIINKRRVINGEDDGLMQVSPLKHPFADEIFKTMLKNTWVPQEVPMGKDVEMWNTPGALTEQEKRVYERSLAFVSNLDGIQTNNLVINITRQITSPEVSLAIVRQAYEEALHVHSYATMIEALNLNPEDVYGLYRKDMELYNKNKRILQSFGKIAKPDFKTGTFEKDQLFLEACVANIVLEGIYFYSAFLIFYIFRRNNKMPGSADMIQFINRDEDMHLKLFISITNTIKEEQPELWTEGFQKEVRKIITDAVDLEYEWGKSCIGDGILGLTPENLREYLQFIGDMRLQMIGLPKKWNSKNPFPWIDEITQSSMIEVNFFEGTVKEYSIGTLDWD
ncbi:ribonucleotide-diphosphate reductase subunit beta [Candidatus Woesearchaeota archaeon]|nr:ribonucleotide-diphosphate reductase subunit beta [Candidatus Woesearchaeota archaeon]